MAARATLNALNHAISLAIPGASTIDIFREVMRRALSNSHFRAAFPLMIAVNEQLAHCCPSRANWRTLQVGDVVSFDFGLAVTEELLFADYAVTVEVSPRITEDPREIQRTIALIENMTSQTTLRAPSSTIGELNTFQRSYFALERSENVCYVQTVAGHEISPGRLHGTRDIRILPQETSDYNYLLPEGVYTIEPLLAITPISTEELSIPFRQGGNSGVYSCAVNVDTSCLSIDSRAFLDSLLREYGDEVFGCYFSEEQLAMRYPEMPFEELQLKILDLLQGGFLLEDAELHLPDQHIGFHFERSFFISENRILTPLEEL